jgi:TonB family protein
VTKERVKTNDREGRSIIGRRFLTSFQWLAPGDANPDWLHKPTGMDLAAAFPSKAIQDGVAGHASIKCNVTIEGFLERCQILSESPEAYGFGAAALQLAPQFRMSPKIRAGKPVGSEVTIPINWGAPPPNGPQATLGQRRLLMDPPWTAAPTLEQVRGAWPAGAAGVSAGQAALRCAIGRDGGLKECSVISEIPEGKGFGRAARSLSSAFKIYVKPEDAKDARNLSVDVPFRFRDPALPDTRKLTRPRWTTTLSAEGMAKIYPETAIKAGVFTGLGVIDCGVDAGGHLVDCSAKREDPAGRDFGAAAIQAAQIMVMNPWTKEGDTVDGLRITLPIRFNWQPGSPAPTEP